MAEKPADGVVKPSLEKLKALQLAMDKIEKDHGKGTIMKMGDSKVVFYTLKQATAVQCRCVSDGPRINLLFSIAQGLNVWHL